jgi:uncharacterized repeat protein (TIGR02543 family)
MKKLNLLKATIFLFLVSICIINQINAQTGTVIIPEVTMINNSGVLIKIGDKKILLDALTLDAPDSVNNKIINGISPFDNINMFFVSHTHSDHFDSSLVASFMEKHTESKLFTNSACLNTLSASRLSTFQNRVFKINDQSSTTQTFTIDGMQLRTRNLGEMPFYCNYSGFTFLFMADSYYILPGLIPTNQKINFILSNTDYMNYTDATKYKTEHHIPIHYNPAKNTSPEMQTDRKIDDVIYLYFHNYIETKKLVKDQYYQPSYQVIFDGSGVGYSTNAIADSGKVAPNPQLYSRDYTFKAWYKETEKINEWNFLKDVVTHHTNLYGKDSILTHYTVNFNSNGGLSVTSQTVNYFALVTKPYAPTKAGYTFAGWYENSAFTQLWDFSSRRIFFNITLYAKWTTTTFVENKQDAGFKLYPNPAKDKLYINFNSPITSGVIYDLQGKLVVEIVAGTTQIDVSNLLNGAYIIKIITSGNIFVDKLIKE